VNLHSRESGPPEAARRGTVVFIHGFPFDGSMWAPQLDGLPEGWRGLAPDLRGFGETELRAVPGEVARGNRSGSRVALPDEPVLTMDRHARDVAELIEGTAAAPAVLCGLSMGGYVALALWRLRPELVRALVLADTRSEGDSDEARENRMRLAQSTRTHGARALAAAMLPSLLADDTRHERPEVADRLRDMMEATAPETLVAALAGMAGRRDATPELSDIRVPTLVLVGESDGLTPPDGARAMARAIPGARLVTIPGAGHVSNLENVEAFNEALHDFLTRL
jgi:3-oxoadipate enol-lactonase